MEITPTQQGAQVDITDDAHHLIELLADVFDREPELVASRLHALAQHRRELAALKASAEAGRQVSEVRIEWAATAVDGVRDAIVDLLDPKERVTVALTAAGCRRNAARLLEAACSAEERYRTPGQLPAPRDGRAA